MIVEGLARALVRWRWVVIAVWVVIGAVAFYRAPKTPDRLALRGGSNEPTEARLADRLLAERFARPFGEFFAVTIEGPESFATGAGRAALDSLTAAAARLPYVQSVVSYATRGDSLFLSDDGRLTFFLVSFSATGDSVGNLVRPFRVEMQHALAKVPNRPGYQLRVTGRSALDLDVRTVSAEDGRRFELRLLPLTLVILVLAFGALVAALLPLAIGVLAIAVSLTAIGLLATVMPMSVFVLNLTTMIGLGVGIDYSLLMVTRFREELARGSRRREAAERTLVTAGVAVFNSGLTVVVGFAALLLTPMVETRSVGIGGLVVVAVAVLLSVTLLPALLAALGRAIDRPRWLAKRLTWYHAPQVWEKWARSLARHPIRALAVGSAVIIVLTLPVFWIRIGLPARNWWPAQTEAGAGVETLSKMGVSGYITPVRVLVEVPEGKAATQAVYLRGLRALSDSMRRDPRVLDVRSIVDLEPGTSILAYSLLYSDLDSARVNHQEFLDAYLSRDTRVALVDVILRDTTSLTSAMAVVERARALVDSSAIRQLRDAKVSVGGYVAASLDLQTEMLRRFPLLIGLVLSATAVMLAIAFRSILVPLKAVLMNSLSVSATFGLIVLVFQHGYGGQLFHLTGPTEAIFVLVPVLVFAVVFGLSMDYEVFLLSRIKEAFDRSGKNTEATMEGLSATASVITSAALIMICVFGAFAFARVLVMQFLGFGLALAVLLDATVIRMVLVPAFMHLMGRWNWWPGARRS
ncbi:MAG: MMPL family transporter [Gemmatimonadetes bacterium]|nr:MMPL family transporter [Gemmatimonadota bacterium]MCC7133673.1 MMPL family transporter [Gemmatimonadales bacterium]